MLPTVSSSNSQSPKLILLCPYTDTESSADNTRVSEERLMIAMLNCIWLSCGNINLWCFDAIGTCQLWVAELLSCDYVLHCVVCYWEIPFVCFMTRGGDSRNCWFFARGILFPVEILKSQRFWCSNGCISRIFKRLLRLSRTLKGLRFLSACASHVTTGVSFTTVRACIRDCGYGIFGSQRFLLRMISRCALLFPTLMFKYCTSLFKRD